MDEKLIKIAEGITPDNLDSACDTLLSCGIIDSEEETQIRTHIMKEEREKQLKKYNFYEKVWERNGYYYIWVPDLTKPKSRRQVKRKDKDSLADIFLKAIEDSQAVTIADLFHEYLSKKVDEGLRKSSACTYQQVFDRHYVSNHWDKMDIRKLSAWDFAEFLDKECSINSLTPHNFGNLKTISAGIVKRASRRHLINYSISDVFDNIENRPRSKKYTTEERVFSDDEVSRLVGYIMENRDVQNLALLIMLLSGIRVGECVGLRFDSFITPTLFKVERTEIKYKDGDKWVYALSDTTKTDAGQREVAIHEYFSWILPELRILNPDSEFICSNARGERMTANCLRRRLHRICDKLGFEYNKATHCLRRTCLTNEGNKGFSLNLIRAAAGHRDGRTTQLYIFDRPESMREAKQDMANQIYDFLDFPQASNT